MAQERNEEIRPSESKGARRIWVDRQDLIDFYRQRVGIFRNLRSDKTDQFSAGIGPNSGEGFPIPRPVKWPNIMSWPPENLRANWSQVAHVLRQANLDPSKEKDADRRREMERQQRDARETLKDLVYSHAEQAKMMEQIRNETVHYIDDGAVAQKIPLWARTSLRDPIKESSDVCWASLIVPNGNARIQEVGAWGRNSAVTMDGGVVLADHQKVRIHKFSPQAAALLANECAARGWPEAHLNVPYQHVQEMKAACAAAKIDVVITPVYGILRLKGRKEVLHRKPPVHDFQSLVDTLREARKEGHAKEEAPSAEPARDEPGAHPVTGGEVAIKRPRPKFEDSLRDVTPGEDPGTESSSTRAIFGHGRALPKPDLQIGHKKDAPENGADTQNPGPSV